MADKLDKHISISVENEKDRAHDLTVRGRRALLKGAVAVMPMILTLQSGAALARSSNMISPSDASGAKDSAGRTLCLDYRFVESLDSSGRADLGEPPYASVTAITERDYRLAKGGDAVDESQMCRVGDRYFYKNDGREWVETDYIPPGMLVSAIALSSFAGSIDITEI